MTTEGTSCVVIGGGLAGISTARRIQQLGRDVVVLEKGTDDYGHNNARISGGLVHLGWRAMDEDPAELERYLRSETDDEIDPAVAGALAGNAGRAIEWLSAEGVDMRPKGDKPYQRHALYPHRPGTGTRIAPEFGPDRMMRALWDNFRDAGGRVLLGATAEALTHGADKRWRVTFRTAENRAELEAENVVVADGGFQGNSEMLSAYVGPNASLSVLRAWPSAVGDGLRMLLPLGAATRGLGRVYGHMVSRDALTDDNLWPYPAMDKLCLTGVLVDRAGVRFGAASQTGVELVTRLARSEDPRGYAVVFDDGLWQTAGRDNPYNTAVPNPDLVDRGGHFVSAEDLDGLAAQLQVDAQRLKASVAEHNAIPGATKIEHSPYHAARVAPGITFTMGGVRIDEAARVIDVDGHALTGLYAAGSAVGGVHGGPHGGYVGGLAVALELGLIAAEHIAAAA
jgi:fumarate reductase flavoprotein subunit